MGAAVKKKSHIKGLGRGLDALLGDAPTARAGGAAAGDKRELPIEFLKPNTNQPRRKFDAGAIDELAQSIRARGLLQPILVRPIASKGGGKDEYEIVAGERRWRAAQKAKLHDVPVIIRELTDEETAEISLIENVQRVDLNPMEEAQGYQRLIEHYKRTQEEISKAVGKSRSHVGNMLRLLNLPKLARDALLVGEISMGHARALLSASKPEAMCALIIERGLSVRETEDMVRETEDRAPDGRARKGKKGGKPKSSSGPKDADTRALERDLSQLLGLEVEIEHSKKGSGAVTIRYLTLDQLDDICRRLMGAGI